MNSNNNNNNSNNNSGRYLRGAVADEQEGV